ncbi:hypothetical protein BT63DRAFT_423557 [Microthyrium microscopicum]|uniref:Uncharacterized protein n=1 Tax=Microthyrium microscopicum TaxID=703497 RepID=A0A6A6UGE9_9PEZI|nr:hypothetical protein BT63DRAFT_423557 [Microthyrium microscopicum]
MLRPSTFQRLPHSIRTLTTLSTNPSIYAHPSPSSIPQQHILSLLPTSPPTPNLALGTTTALPPTTTSFTPNRSFSPILHSVLKQYATQDPAVQMAANAYASEAGFTASAKQRGRESQGGSGGAKRGGSVGRGGWVHVSDSRRPPDWGRISDPEDIFGSVEVDAEGKFVGENGNYQDSGTYRMITRDGILGLSPFLMGKLVERLKVLEKEAQA